MADAGLLKLHTLLEWIKEFLTYNTSLRTGDYNFVDKIFITEINNVLQTIEQQYEKMLYCEVRISFDFNLYRFHRITRVTSSFLMPDYGNV